MEPATIISAASAISTVIVAVGIPYWTFRLALRQERGRWLREQRAALYVDMLAEAYAEQQWFDFDQADDETRELMRPHFTDLRLPPRERARLGARGKAYGDESVNKAFNRLQGVLARASLFRGDDAQQMLTRVEAGRAQDELEAAIRRDLGGDLPGS